MAKLHVEMRQDHGFAHCLDVYEFVAAAGNVNHQVVITIHGDACRYLRADYIDADSGKSTLKILRSLPLYDVDDIYADLPDHERPAFVQALAAADISQCDGKVCF